MGQLNHEPSMEDILASIKRIIAEDSEAVGARPPRLRKEAMAEVAASPVLATKRPKSQPPVMDEAETPEPELAEELPAPVEMDEESDPQSALDADDAPGDILELTSPMPAPAEPAAAIPADVKMSGFDGLLSSTAAVASRNAFAALSQLQVRAEAGQENTLEGLVTDMLRPMLREWLDRELPALVERLVAAEVARLSGRG